MEILDWICADCWSSYYELNCKSINFPLGTKLGPGTTAAAAAAAACIGPSVFTQKDTQIQKESYYLTNNIIAFIMYFSDLPAWQCGCGFTSPWPI